MLQYETPGYFKFLLNTQQERQIAEERFVQQETSLLTKDAQPRFSTKLTFSYTSSSSDKKMSIMKNGKNQNNKNSIHGN